MVLNKMAFEKRSKSRYKVLGYKEEKETRNQERRWRAVDPQSRYFPCDLHYARVERMARNLRYLELHFHLSNTKPKTYFCLLQ